MNLRLLTAAVAAGSCATTPWSSQRDADTGLPPWQQDAGPELVTADWLKAHLKDSGLVVFQVAQDRLTYEAGHVPGAIFAPLGEFHSHMQPDHLPDATTTATTLGRLGLSNTSRVVLVGDPVSTSILFVALDYVGHGGRTAVLDGGLTAWRESGGQLTHDTPVVTPATFIPNVRENLVVDATWVRAHLDDRQVVLLDGRTLGEFDGSADDMVLERRGHIPGARLVPWLNTFDTRDVPVASNGERDQHWPDAARLLPRSELERLLATAGARRDGLVVTYCTVGMRASHVYFVARLLGYNARLYVGSMADWIRNPANPVVTTATRQ